jgi:RNA polymerase sigma-70 factor, ECF subfamily
VTQVATMDAATGMRAEPLSRSQFEDFYRRTSERLRAYIHRVAGSGGPAEDLLQESYVRLLTAPAMAEQALKSYLYRTATNLAMDYHRAQSRQRRWWELAVRRGEAVESKTELGSDMERLFLQLPAQQRALLWLAYVEQAEHREIAAILRLSPRSVKVMLHRARGKMEAILKANGFEGPHERR